MATLDYIQTVGARLWALIDAHTPTSSTYINAGNRIHWDGSKVSPVKPNSQPADYPELLIEDGDFDDSLFNVDPTFGTNKAGYIAGDCDWTENISVDFTITITHRDPRIGTADRKLGMEVMTALRKGGPRLNDLAGVVGFSMVGKAKRGRVSIGNVKRAQTKIIINVRLQFSGRDLLA